MKEVNEQGLTEEEFLKEYKPGNYERPSVTVDMPIFAVNSDFSNLKMKILLIKRRNHPYISKWALPGGFVDKDEKTIDAAKRELMEETGVNNVFLENIGVYSKAKRDPRTWVISCGYMALVKEEDLVVTALDDAKDAKWFEIITKKDSEIKTNLEDSSELVIKYIVQLISDEEKIEFIVEKKIIKNYNFSLTEVVCVGENDLAFDHGEIIGQALDILNAKAMNSDIIFNILPRKFTKNEFVNTCKLFSDDTTFKEVLANGEKYINALDGHYYVKNIRF